MAIPNTAKHRFRTRSRVSTAMASALILVALCLVFATAQASLPTTGGVNLTSVAAAPKGGFWVQVDGYANGIPSTTLAVGGAPEFANVPYRGSIAAIPGNDGYWVVTPNGRIFARGTAIPLCDGQLSDCSGFPADPSEGQYVVAVAATPDGQGFWTVTKDGKVFTAGSAVSYGDVTSDPNTPTGIVATPSGLGYYIVLNDGGVFTFGDAIFYGSTGGKKPGGHDVTGLALNVTPSGAVDGYWMVASDGGVLTFGDAPFLGSSGGDNGGSPVTGITTRPDGRSYAWVHGNGNVSLSRTIASVVITSRTYGTVIGVPNASTEPGIALQLAPASGGTSQEWRIWPTTPSGNLVQLVNVNSALCADITGPVHAAAIIQYPCKGQTEGWENQLWTMITDHYGITQFVPYGQPYYSLSARSDGILFLVFAANHNPGWTLADVE